jgi:hypothetical protein
MDPRRHHEPPPGHTSGSRLCRPPPAAGTAPATAPKPAVTGAGLGPSRPKATAAAQKRTTSNSARLQAQNQRIGALPQPPTAPHPRARTRRSGVTLRQRSDHVP